MDENMTPEITESPRKRKSHGRLSDAAKRMRAQTHEPGADCKCVKLKCFSNITLEERMHLIQNFNSLGTYNAQNIYLSGLITTQLVKRRRNRNHQDEAQFHSYSYKYKVCFMRDGGLLEVPVCYKAMISLHGITPRRMQHIQEQMTTHGKVIADKRGKHKNRRHALKSNTLAKVHEHIQSLQGRKAHYSLKKSDKIYLPDSLNIKKLHKMFLQKYSDFSISYHSYRKIFVSKYNISFGYPRYDTCSKCDEFTSKESILKKKIAETVGTSKENLTEEHNKLITENKVHKKKAQVFYDRKKQSGEKARKNFDFEAVAFDFQKNMPLPNITTNDVYYRRQLSVYLFNVHILSTGESVFYCYDQTIAKKGSDEVVSMMHHFIFNILSSDVRHLALFCDSCAGQNKNFTMFRYLHYVVHKCHRLDSVTVTFPERGHSYMECDRNMALLPKHAITEIPSDLYELIENARVKPSPFQVVRCNQYTFKKWTIFFKSLGYYKMKLTVPARPIKEISITVENPRFFDNRTSFNGQWLHTVITEPVKKHKSKTKTMHKETHLKENEFMLPNNTSSKLIPIPTLKWKDLQVIQNKFSFCRLAT